LLKDWHIEVGMEHVTQFKNFDSDNTTGGQIIGQQNLGNLTNDNGLADGVYDKALCCY
jgi:hypothetical protein